MREEGRTPGTTAAPPPLCLCCHFGFLAAAVAQCVFLLLYNFVVF